MSNNYFIFNENKCVGCEACVVACVLENGIQFPERWRTIFSSNEKKMPGIPLFNLSLACNHCEDALCMKYCPSLAYSRDPITGAIIIDSESCLGCGYCTWNCPYEAPKMNPITNVVQKCNFCNSRLLEEKAPACSTSCPTGALDFSFEEIDNASIPHMIKVPENPYPSIVVKKSEKRSSPEMDLSLFDNIAINNTKKTVVSKVSANKELPLLIFTLIVSLMIAVSASDIIDNQGFIIKIGFVLTGVIGGLISTIHLGKKQRFWKSILNIRNSWLSREIVFFSMYMGLTIIDLLLISVPKPIIVLAGLATLLSIDMLYKPLQWKWKTQWHSGQVLFISTTFFLLLNQLYVFLIIIMLIRLGLTILMYSKSKVDIMPIIWILFMVKATLLVYNNFEIWLILSVYIVGEVAARIVFYNDLEIYNVDSRPRL